MDQQLNELKSFKMIPNHKLKQKLDYYYAPYSPIYNINKGMVFDGTTTTAQPDWSCVKDIVLQSDAEVFSTILRQLKMQCKNNKEFLMKYKLLQRHPSIIKPSHKVFKEESKLQTRSVSANGSRDDNDDDVLSTDHHNPIDSGHLIKSPISLKNLNVKLQKKKRLRNVEQNGESILIQDKAENMLMDRARPSDDHSHDKSDKSRISQQQRNGFIGPFFNQTGRSSISPMANQTHSDLSLKNINQIGRIGGGKGNLTQRKSSEPYQQRSILRQLLLQQKKENVNVKALDRDQILKSIELLEQMKKQRQLDSQQQSSKKLSPQSSVTRRSRNVPEKFIMKSNSQFILRSSREKHNDTNTNSSFARNTLMINLRFPDIKNYPLELESDMPRKPLFQGLKMESKSTNNLRDERSTSQQPKQEQTKQLLEQTGTLKTERVFQKTNKIYNNYNKKNFIMAKTQDRFLQKIQKDIPDQSLNEIINQMQKTQTQFPLLNKQKSQQLSDFVIFNDGNSKSRVESHNSKIRDEQNSRMMEFASNHSLANANKSRASNSTPIFRDSIVTIQQ